MAVPVVMASDSILPRPSMRAFACAGVFMMSARAMVLDSRGSGSA